MQDPDSTMRCSLKRTAQQRDPCPALNGQQLLVIDDTPPDLLQEPNPHDMRRVRRLEEAASTKIREEGRQNLQRREEQRAEAVQKARVALEAKMPTSAQTTNLQERPRRNRRRNKRKRAQSQQVPAEEPQIITLPLARYSNMNADTPFPATQAPPSTHPRPSVAPPPFPRIEIAEMQTEAIKSHQLPVEGVEVWRDHDGTSDADVGDITRQRTIYRANPKMLRLDMGTTEYEWCLEDEGVKLTEQD